MCRKQPDGEPCAHCVAVCRRKHRYPTYQQARDQLPLYRVNMWDDPTLRAYRCKIGDHYHLGHASGQDAKRLRKRAEKFRRKALIQGARGES